MAENNKDYLWLNLRDLPYFRALLRAVEARFYDGFDLVRPILDLGCGDGHFASIAFDEPVDFGIDPWTGPIKNARKLDSHLTLIQSEGSELPFGEQYFATVVSNSVLEHIIDIDSVLEEVARTIRSGGQFLFCVPNHQFLNNLSVSRILSRFGMRELSTAYQSFFNKISRHHHCDSPEIWDQRLRRAGFVLERWWHYFSPGATQILEWGHYLGLPSLISHFIFGRWIICPTPWNLWLTRSLLQPYFDEPSEQLEGSYTFFIARRV